MAGSLTTRLAAVPRLLSGLVVVALLVALVIAFVPRSSTRTMTVDFPRTVSLYEGSEVRILGVPVGRVETISPRGDTVRVTLAYDSKYKVPADVSAAIVSPAIVGDRFVQLAPAYSGGPVLADDAVLAKSKAQVPVELDQVYQSLDDLSVALGPNGANKDGSLSDLVDSSAANLGGEGEKINQTIEDFSQLSTTLANNKDDLFASVEQINAFVRMLRENDSSVRAFNSSLADAAGTLSGEREDLAATLEQLAAALGDVETFVKTNRTLLRTNVENLTSITQTVVKNREQLDQTLRNAPVALSNLALTYNPKYGTLDNRAAILDGLLDSIGKPDRSLCALLGETGAPDDVCSLLGPLLPDLGSLGGAGGVLPRVAPSSAAPTGERHQQSVEQIMGVTS
ncbi:MCE family protein [Solicola sp. PLA-1-18]|uniref:MCE family protein n=1 Tax=Solicola sp. PLA-1-18 TaxID=3380532 RepID=UPI003B7A36E9